MSDPHPTPTHHPERFPNRTEAGRRLAEAVVARLGGPERARSRPGLLVLGLPRGGVPVAAEVAAALGAPLSVVVARRITPPGRPEPAIGAVAEGLDHALLGAEATRAGLSGPRRERAVARAEAEVTALVDDFRHGLPLPQIRGRTVIVVDDGLATGFTAEAACRAVRRRSPAWLIMAVPVAAETAAARLALTADEVIALRPMDGGAVGAAYERFEDVGDEEVRRLLAAPRTSDVPHTIDLRDVDLHSGRRRHAGLRRLSGIGRRSTS